jgi:hypothetical protein
MCRSGQHAAASRIAAVLGLILTAAAQGCILDMERKALVPPNEDAAAEPVTESTDAVEIADIAEPDPDITDVPVEAEDTLPDDGCIPLTCTALGVECGEYDNGCGGTTVCVCPDSVFECMDGTCTCPSGLDRCGDSCFDMSSSDLHCGECFHGCPADWFCSEAACEPECPSGWRASVVSEESGFAYCYSDYQGNDNCCVAWSRCTMLGARPGWGWGPDLPSELAGMVPVIVLRARTDMLEGDCNYACYEADVDGNPAYSGSRSFYGCTAGSLCFDNCDSTACSGVTMEWGCACPVPFWCYIQIGPS